MLRVFGSACAALVPIKFLMAIRMGMLRGAILSSSTPTLVQPLGLDFWGWVMSSGEAP
jgi:hypothetical protein